MRAPRTILNGRCDTLDEPVGWRSPDLPRIPLPPLDGSAALLLGLGEDTGRRYQQFLMSSQSVGIMGLIVAWRVFDVVFDPVFLSVINVLYPGVTYGG